VKLDLNLSPLGGEQISTPVSNVSSNLHSDAVEQDLSLKRFTAAVDQTKFRQVFQGQIVLPVIDRKDKLMEWFVSVLEGQL
jgi:hypothetical protein